MWDSTLKKIDHHKTPQIATELWGGDVETLMLISNGINLVYRFEYRRKGMYLRITHPKIRSPDELAGAIDYQRHLQHFGAQVCEPLLSRQGNYIEEIIQGDLVFLAHAAKEVPGVTANFSHSNQYFYENWGKELANLHFAARHYQPPNNFTFKTWQDLQNELVSYLKSENKVINDEFYKINEYFSKLLQDSNNYGLTHGDHRHQNVLYDGKEIYIIDFDEPVYHWFGADIARPFLIISHEPLIEWTNKLSWYLEGYNSILPLSRSDIEQLPWFIRMKTLEIYLWTKNNWHDPTAPGGNSTKIWLSELEKAIQSPITHF